MAADGWTRTTCPYCGVGCGVLAKPRSDGSAEIWEVWKWPFAIRFSRFLKAVR